MKTAADGYIHGFSAEEQERLWRQARVLEEMIYEGVDLSGCRRILEIGSGVGAQTRNLLKRFPRAHVTAVEISAAQIESAKRSMSREARVTFLQEDASRLSLPERSQDGAFICWVLEHVKNPVEILKEVRRVLAPGGSVHGIEVMNSSFFLQPESPAVMEYWAAFNRRQAELGGDPFVGAKMGHYLAEAGFSEIELKPYVQLYDQRDPQALLGKLDYWENLLLSAAPQLGCDPRLLRRMREEFRAARTDPAAVFYYTPFKFRARA